VTLTESDAKGGGGSVDSEHKGGEESTSERVQAVGTEERLQDDFTLRRNVDAQDGRKMKSSVGIIKTVRWEVASKPTTFSDPDIEEL
jgi:hypothetical protein